MNIAHIGGNGGIERSSDRPARTEGKRGTDAKSVDAQDRSSISDSGRETAAAISALAERAK
ncbi:MAG TPA: hypothetical protein VK348_15905, partial [Planctomycetota bacterium]|nr:hypothetical protein [Planctomycetota bacterium]